MKYFSKYSYTILFAFIQFCIVGELFGQRPANDDLSNAIPLALNVGCTSVNANNGNNANATSQVGEVGGSCYFGGTNSVWFSLVGPPSGAVDIYLDASFPYNPEMALFALPSGNTNNLADLLEISCSQGYTNNLNSNPEIVGASVVPGQTYYLSVSGVSNTSGNFCIEVNELQFTPSNDDICNASPLNLGANCLVGNNTFATVQAGEVVSCINAEVSGFGNRFLETINSVWYSFTPSSNGIYKFNADLSVSGGIDSIVLALYDLNGNCSNSDLRNLNELICNNRPIIPGVSLNAGTTYYLQASHENSNTGAFCIQVSSVNPVSNDEPCAAPTLPFGSCLDVTIANASVKLNEPQNSCYTPLNSMWYTFVAPSNTNNKISIQSDTNVPGTQLPPYMTLYRLQAGANCSDFSNFVEVACSMESLGSGGPGLAEVEIIPGETYFLSVSGPNGREGSFCLTLGPGLRPANDDLANAQVIGLDVCNTFSDDFATQQQGEIDSYCSGGSQSVWYAFTPPFFASNVKITALFQNPSSANAIAIFALPGNDPTNLADLTEIACASSGTGTVEISGAHTPNGQTYYIAVYNAGGDHCVELTQITPPSNDKPCSATFLSVPGNCTSTLPSNVFATAEINEPIGSCYDQKYIPNSVWFQFFAPASGAVEIRTDASPSGSTHTNTQITLYSLPGGDCDNIADMTEIACDQDGGINNRPDNGVITAASVTPGQFYYISVSGFEGEEGSFCLEIDDIITPSNDSICNAIPLTVGASCTTGTNSLATLEIGENIGDCYNETSSTNSVWYKFIAPSSGFVNINSSNAGSNQADISLYGLLGPACDGPVNMYELACDSRNFTSLGTFLENMRVIPGLEYYIRVVDGEGPFCIEVNAVNPGFSLPPNDDFCNAIPIGVGQACTNPFTNVENATIETGEPIPACATELNRTLPNAFSSIWYKFTAPNSGFVDIDTNIPIANNDGTLIALYALPTGDCNSLTAPLRDLTEIACNNSPDLSIDIPSSQKIPYGVIRGAIVVPGQTYYVQVRVDEKFLGGTTFCMEINEVFGAANDDICQATVLTLGQSCNGIPNGDNTNATRQVNEPEGPCFSGGVNSVWFKFENPEAGGYISVSTDFAGGTNTNTEIALYNLSGSNCNVLSNLVPIACDQDGGLREVNNSFLSNVFVPSNDSTWIQVSGFNGTEGSFCIEVLEVPGPTQGPINDDFCNARSLAVGAGCTVPFGDNTNSGAETGEPDGSCYVGGINSVWYKFEAPPSGIVSITTDIPVAGVTNTDTEIALFSKLSNNCNDFSDLVEIACSQDEGTQIIYNSIIPNTSVNPGEMYYVSVSGWRGTEGTFCIEVNDIPPPVNDDVCDAEPLTLNGGVQTFSNLAATPETNESSIAPGIGQNGWLETEIDNSVWFTFQPANSSKVSIDLCNNGSITDFNTQVAVYSVGDCNDFSTFTLLGANDDLFSCGESSFLEVSCLDIGSTYYILVDGFNGDAGQFGIRVDELGVSPLLSDAGTDKSICVGSSTTLGANPSGSGGEGNLSYSWSPSNNLSSASVANPDANPNTTTVYTLTVSDNAGCSTSSSTTVTVNPLPAAPVISGSTAYCEGTAGTSLDAGPGYSNYLWLPDSFDTRILTVTAGTYSVRITDNNGCSETSSSVTVTENPLPEPIITGATEYCEGTSGVTLDAGAGFSSYSWSPGGATSRILTATAGTYSVTVTDANNCTGTSPSFAVTENPLPEPIITGATEYCEGTSGVTLDAGAGFSSYVWSPSGSTNRILSATAGTYTVTVTDANNCSGTSPSFGVTENPLPEPIITGATEYCEGTSGVSLDAGAGYSSYAWSPGGSTNRTLSATAGTYTVTVTDANNCSGTSPSFGVTENPLPEPVITGATEYCEGTSGVTLDAGAGYSSYAWSPGGSTNRTLSATAGTYTVTVTDANNCSGTSPSFGVTENPLPEPVITGATEYCEGTSGVTLDAGAGFSSYVWSPGGSTNRLLSATAGTYTVTVTDANNCSGTSPSFGVTENPLPEPVITGATEYCEGTSGVTLDAGAGYSSYAWSPGGATSRTLNATSGTYTVTVTDANNCSGTSPSFGVAENPLPEPVITGATEYCEGTSGVTLDAGAGYSSYAWSPGGSANRILSATAGTYTVTVTDANNCSGTSPSFGVTENPLPEPIITGATEYCEGTSGVSLDAGAGYVSYAWSPGGATSRTLNATSGTYTVTVTDANNCSGTSPSFGVTENPLPEPVITGATEYCEGTSGVTLDAGAGYASYAWSPSGSTNRILSATAGTYTVTVTDANNCSGTSPSFGVTENPLPEPIIMGDDNYCTGTSGVVLDAGTGYSTYLWAPGGATTQTLSATAGNYTVTVTDANNCSGTSPIFTVIENRLPTPQIQGPTEYCSGTAGVSLDAGAAYVSYAWTPGGESTQTINALAGTYSVSVIDVNGCAGNSPSFTVMENTSITPFITGPSQYCEGTSGVVLDAGANFSSYVWAPGGETTQAISVSAGIYSVTVSDGNGCGGTSLDFTVIETPLPIVSVSLPDQICINSAPVTVSVSPLGGMLSGPGVSGNMFDPAQLSIGSYTVLYTFADINGCSNSDSILVEVVNSPTVSLPRFADICEGEAALPLSGGFPMGGIYSGPGVNSSGMFDPLVAGVGNHTITYTYTDSLGCGAADTATLIVAPIPSISLDSLHEICISAPAYVLNEGTPTGGSYFGTGVSGNQFDPSIAGVGSFEIFYTLMTGSGCSDTVSRTISVLDFPAVSMDSLEAVCPTSPAFVLTGGAPAGGNYTGPGVSGGMFDPGNVGAGSYTITYTYASAGCIDSASSLIEVSGSVTVDAGEDQVICPGTSIEIGGINTASEGIGPYSYSWEPALGLDDSLKANPIATPDENTVYRVTVSDACENSAFDEVMLSFPDPLSLSVQQMASDSGQDNGSARVEIEGGLQPYTINWSTGASTDSISDLSPGQYIVTVMDECGEMISDTLNIGTVGIDDLLNAGVNRFEVYPNPSIREFQIHIDLLKQSDLEIALYDLRGRQIWSDEKRAIFSYKDEVNVREKAAEGIYILEVKTSWGAVYKRLIFK